MQVSEKNGTFICELILERYIYLLKTTENHKLWPKQSFSEFYLIYDDVYLKLRGSLLYKLGEVASLCIKIRGWFCITTFHVLSTFYSVFVYISYTVKVPLIYWLYSEVGSSSVFTLSEYMQMTASFHLNNAVFVRLE